MLLIVLGAGAAASPSRRLRTSRDLFNRPPAVTKVSGRDGPVPGGRSGWETGGCGSRCRDERRSRRALFLRSGRGASYIYPASLADALADSRACSTGRHANLEGTGAERLNKPREERPHRHNSQQLRYCKRGIPPPLRDFRLNFRAGRGRLPNPKSSGNGCS